MISILEGKRVANARIAFGVEKNLKPCVRDHNANFHNEQEKKVNTSAGRIFESRSFFPNGSLGFAKIFS
jgi:hypothetical protein